MLTTWRCVVEIVLSQIKETEDHNSPYFNFCRLIKNKINRIHKSTYEEFFKKDCSESWCVEELEAIILNCNLFDVCWRRSVALIYSYPSLICPRMRYSWEKLLHIWNTHEKKFRTYEIPKGKSFGPMKYPRENISDSQNIHQKKKKWDPRNTREKTIWTHETPKEKKLGPSKAWWHDGTRPTRLKIVRYPQNLAHSFKCTDFPTALHHNVFHK